jgi:hypothetical protein
MSGLLLASIAFVLVCGFGTGERLRGRLRADRSVTRRTMDRFGLSHGQLDTTTRGRRSPSRAPVESQQAAPTLGDMLFEIGVVVALHLGFALAVLVTLDAFGVR